jgi:hypothetical protein
MPASTCPRCGKIAEVFEGTTRLRPCGACGQVFDIENSQPPVAKTAAKSRQQWLLTLGFRQKLGWVIFGTALIFAWAVGHSDVSVYVGAGIERTFNLGLADDRRNSMLLWLFISGCGLALALAGRHEV